MRISARCDYACKALLELALHWPSKDPVQIRAVSANQGIPTRYLVQILIQLKGMGLVESVRGKEGGYRLSKPPGRISLGELMREMSGPLLPVTSSLVRKNSLFSAIWSEVEDAMAKVLDRITFEDISNKARGLEKALIYQI